MSHERIDEISLEMGRRVVSRLREQPSLMLLARDNLARWTRRNSDAPSLLTCYSEWEEILRRPLEQVCELLTADTEEARRLRQNSPFAGFLSPREVWSLKQAGRHVTPPA